MSGKDEEVIFSAGWSRNQPADSPSANQIRWLLGFRVGVISILFLSILLIQGTSEKILPLQHFYEIILGTYGLSLIFLILYVLRLPIRIQAILQLLGDIAIVTSMVYFTGGLYSPFSFLYLAVIVSGAIILRGGGLIFAGLSAIAYGGLIDLIFFEVLKNPPNLGGSISLPSTPRVISQLMIHIIGFILLAILVSYMAENLRRTRSHLREAEERSRRLEAVTEHVVRSVNAGIIATDLRGIVLHINPAGLKILHPPKDGTTLNEILPLEEQNLSAQLARIRSTRSPLRLTARHKLSGQSLGLTIGPLEDDTGEIVGFIFNFQDLTQVQALQEQQRQQERMAATGEMAARMAHEIKNPLAGISGSAQMLASMQAMEGNQTRLLEIIVQESHRLSSILDTYLDYSRPESLQPRVLDIVPLLKDWLQLFKASEELLPGHKISLSVPDSALLLGHEELLKQIFWNLARNAIAAMQEQGLLEISIEPAPGRIQLNFRDSGSGMSEEIRRQAFEPFISNRKGGTGLGLAIVYNAVERHEGRIEIESCCGEGTTVRIELPQRINEDEL